MVQFNLFELNADSGTIEHTIETNSFLSVKSYLCTLSRGCFVSLDCREASSSKIFTLDAGRIALMTAHKVTLTTKAIDHITTLCVSDDQQSQKASIINISTDLKNVQEVDEQIWVKCGDVTLTKQEKDRLIGGHELSDTHINFAQLLLKQQFPNIDGFRNTLQQNKPFINQSPPQN